jgi:hypothetical protein
MEKYTIATAMPTGKTSPMFGTEYHVKFAENEGTFKLWYKTEPKQGQEQEGTIDGWKFTKKKFDPNAQQVSSATTSKPWAPKRDNSDGMRQGMCINNAANFVNALGVAEMSDTDWAKMVHDYATALDRLGDLSMESSIDEAPASVKEVFSAK